MMPDLGKYAVEVISAYIVTIGLIVALVAVSLRQSRRTRDALRKVEEARQSRRPDPKERSPYG
jgi:heme exporter protein D